MNAPHSHNLLKSPCAGICSVTYIAVRTAADTSASCNKMARLTSALRAWPLSLSPRCFPNTPLLRAQVVSTDGDHGTGWFDVQRLPEELWADAPPKRMPLRRLAEVYSEEEAVPLLKQELSKARDPAVASRCAVVP